MGIAIKCKGDEVHLFKGPIENAIGTVAETLDMEEPAVVEIPGFDGIDKENIARLFSEQITKHREQSNCDHIAGKIDDDRHAWNLGHADYMEGLYDKIVAFLNAGETLPDQGDDAEDTV